MVGDDSLSQPPGNPTFITRRNSTFIQAQHSIRPSFVVGKQGFPDDYTDHGYQSVVSFLGVLLLISLHGGYQRAPCAQIKGRSRGLDLKAARKF